MGEKMDCGEEEGGWLGDEDDDEKGEGARGEKEGAGEGGGKGGKVVEAYEIAHIPGIGAYGLDSWRIFCRDELRGFNADTRGADGNARQPEWQRVLPLDKELRAYLRWRWLKEGWVWDPLDGAKRRASPEEIEVAERGV